MTDLETRVAGMRENLTREFAGIQAKVDGLFKPSVRGGPGQEVTAADLEATERPSFAQEHALPKTTVNEIKLVYPGTFEATARALPKDLSLLLVQTIKPFALHQREASPACGKVIDNQRGAQPTTRRPRPRW